MKSNLSNLELQIKSKKVSRFYLQAMQIKMNTSRWQSVQSLARCRSLLTDCKKSSKVGFNVGVSSVGHYCFHVLLFRAKERVMKLLNFRCKLSYLTRDACIWSEEFFSPVDYIDVLCCPTELPILPSTMWIHEIIEWFGLEGT